MKVIVPTTPTHLSIPLLLLAILMSCLFCACTKVDVISFETPPFTPPEHNHLIQKERVFENLNFLWAQQGQEGSIFYLASDNEESATDYFLVGDPNQPLEIPESFISNAYSIGKLSGDGNRIWSKSFDMVPYVFLLLDADNNEASLLVAGTRIVDGIRKIVLMKLSALDGEIQSEIELNEDVYTGSPIKINLAKTREPNKYLLTVKDNSIYNYGFKVLEIEVTEISGGFNVITASDFTINNDFIQNELSMLGSLNTAVYAVLHETTFFTENFDNKISFLDENLSLISESYSNLFFEYSAIHRMKNRISPDDNKVYLLGRSFPDTFSFIPSIEAYGMNGDLLWFKEYDEFKFAADIQHAILSDEQFLYMVGVHSCSCYDIRVEGEQTWDSRIEDNISNGFVSKHDKQTGELMGLYTFSNDSPVLSRNGFHMGFIHNNELRLIGVTGGNDDHDTSTGDGWFVSLNLDDL